MKEKALKDDEKLFEISCESIENDLFYENGILIQKSFGNEKKSDF